MDSILPSQSSCKRTFQHFGTLSQKGVATYMSTLKTFGEKHSKLYPNIPNNYRQYLLGQYEQHDLRDKEFFEHSKATSTGGIQQLYTDCMTFLVNLDPINLEMSFIVPSLKFVEHQKQNAAGEGCTKRIISIDSRNMSFADFKFKTSVARMWQSFYKLVSANSHPNKNEFVGIDDEATAILPWPYAWFDNELGTYQCTIDIPIKQQIVHFQTHPFSTSIIVRCTMCNVECSQQSCANPHDTMAIWGHGKRELLCHACFGLFRHTDDMFRPFMITNGEIGLRRASVIKAVDRSHSVLAEKENQDPLSCVPNCDCMQNICAAAIDYRWAPYVGHAFEKAIEQTTP